MTHTTTLNAIRAHGPCHSGWAKLLEHLGKTSADDVPLPFAVIVESNGLDDALWACRSAPQYDRDWRLFAVWCARQVQHLMTDKRSLDALDVAERHANGQATDTELSAAWAAAWDAAGAAARAAAWAAARAAAGAAARAAARDAAGPQRGTQRGPQRGTQRGPQRGPQRGHAARAAARDAAWAAAWDAAWDAQRARFLEIVA